MRLLGLERSSLSCVLAACAVGLVLLSGCSQARKCRDARREARWTAHAYVDSARTAVKALVKERDALREAAAAGANGVALDGEDPATELAQHERAVDEWNARIQAVQDAYALLKGDGPVEGRPLEAFSPRPDEADPAGNEAARRAVQHAIDVCAAAP